MSFIN